MAHLSQEIPDLGQAETLHAKARKHRIRREAFRNFSDIEDERNPTGP